MRLIFGLMLSIALIPAIWFVGVKITEEVVIAGDNQKQLDNSINLPKTEIQLPVTLIDRNNKVFSEEYVEWRQPKKLEEFPLIAKQVFILSEDKEFYNHVGFNVSAIARAIVANSAAQESQQGGSTITQQLVRMRYLTQEKTYERKLMELFYAYKLEEMFSKEKIFEMYLNESYYGNQVYGLAGAATYYFGRQMNDLTVAEIVFLCAIPNNPSLYNPVTKFNNTKQRQERLIDTLVQGNVLSAAEGQTHKQQKITLNIKNKVQKYPSYSTYVLKELEWLIAENEGFNTRLQVAVNDVEKNKIRAELEAKVDTLLQSGLKIYTALDPEKQLDDQAEVNQLLTVPSLQASATVIENETREIVSIYAGKDYKKYDFHRAYQGTRQPGSSLKPLIDYGPFFETTDYTPDYIVSGGNFCIGNFCPENYGGAVYGNVSLRQAFRYSYNTPAVRIFDMVGIDRAFEFIKRFHFKSIVEQDRNYSAALGGLTYGVTTLEMADAYTSFVDGNYIRAHSIRKVTNANGQLLYAWHNQPDPIWSNRTLDYMRELLSDVVRNGTGIGIYSSTTYVGAKTGTTNDYKDYWITGLDEKYTASVWIGYDKPRSMQSLESYKIHHRIFNTVIE